MPNTAIAAANPNGFTPLGAVAATVFRSLSYRPIDRDKLSDQLHPLVNMGGIK